MDTNNKVVKKVVFIFFLPLAILISYFAAKSPIAIETIYSNKVYKLIGQTVSKITGIFSFSVGEFLCYLIIFIFILILIKNVIIIIKKSGNRICILLNIFLSTLAFISISYFLFIMLWGLNYHRLPFSDISGLDTKPASINELAALCDDLIEQGNALRNKIQEDSSGIMKLTYDYNTVFDKAQLGYKEAAIFYPQLKGNYGKPKGVYLSKAMSISGISGIYFPFTCEANINIEIPASMIPSTTCHEMAHQRGFAREDEANFISYLTCRLNPDIQFQYSGTLLALIHSMNALYKYDKEKFFLLRKKYCNGIRQDLEFIRKYWESYEGPVEKASSKLNNVYLKSNYQKDGIHSYGRMVDLLIAEYRQKNKGK
ncbi:DUF3810 domain-containing protein [Paramaledivibacter caminithermalis]|jgi:hypothetical protein|uniref:DUF3810 domain-containing protein n=1 Tax=Paramaledivibacter caminithermalis (strain DSM 15212 / CIP 107654 / DViRD3) TaxID=1121301 RepID=A0A1M6TEE4_PARC5|nr:DUF3810 domain-containing protein [Paramaledivibacter caminithermalis]SHK55259.1 Protein of unknown function [Paramaledivibacter caminithermalis DSM 15212]